MKKFYFLSIALVILISSFTGLFASERTLYFNLGADPKSIEPAVNSALDGGHIINNTFEGLVRLNDGRIEPAMAESWDVSEDGTEYTFHLRESKWSDGVPVKASDFEYAWKRAMDPYFASEYAHHTFYIKGAQDYYEGKGKMEDVGIEVINDKTIKVKLIGSVPYFLDITSRHNFMPVRKDIAEAAPDTWAKDPKMAVSNGPFMLSEYNIGDNIVLKKNPYYWNAKNVNVDKIVVTMIVEATTALTAYNNNEVDIITTIPTQEIPRLMFEDPTFYIEPKMGTYYFIFNVQKTPFDDVKVRKALSLSINRRSIVDNITKGGQIPATGFVPDSLVDSTGRNFRKTNGDFEIDVNKAKVAEAKKYLEKAGYPEGKGFPEVTLLYNTNESHKAVAEAVQAMWKKNLGINIKLMNQEWAVFQDTRHVGNFEIARGGWIGDYLDPMAMLELWTSYSGNNDAQWRWTQKKDFVENKRYDELYNKALSSVGAERDEALYEMEKILMDNMIVAPIYYYTGPVMAKDRVAGWDVTLLGHFYFGRVDIKE